MTQRSQNHDREGPVRAATASLRKVREMLLRPTPESLEECGPVLEAAARLIGKIRPADVADMRPDIDALRRELNVVSALMHQASGFYFGWSQILGAAIGGYRPGGQTASVPAPRRISIEG
jgi:hypothetical protein